MTPPADPRAPTPDEIKAAYMRGWNDREADILERAERIAPPPEQQPREAGGGEWVMSLLDRLTPDVIDAGAQRLASFEDGSVWPDSWDKLDVVQMRIQAERVIRSAIVALAAAPSPPQADVGMVEGYLGTVHIARREDGGLRVWSDTHPGLILSGPDADSIAAPIASALAALSTHARREG